MTKKRIGTMAACLALVGAVAVGGTLALISSQSKQLTNTFTVGDGYDTDGNDFVLKEHMVVQDPVDGGYDQDLTTNPEDPWVYGTPNGTGDPGNTYDDLVPNTSLAKDPTFSIVDSDVDYSWIVAKVSGLTALEEAGVSVETVNSSKWLVLNSLDETTVPTTSVTADIYNSDEDGVVYLIYADKVANNGSTDALFNSMKVGVTVTADNLDLDIEGVAVQALDNSTLNDATLREILAAAKSKLN